MPMVIELGCSSHSSESTSYCPRSKTLTTPSPPTWYRYSCSSINRSRLPPPAVILTTPLTSLAVPVSSSLKLMTASASCARDKTKAACSFSKVVVCAESSGSSADKVRTVAWTFCFTCS